MESKKWYESKVIWTNALALIGDAVLRFTGHALPAGYEVAALSVINIILRKITKHEVVW